MPTELHIDYETYSEVDIKNVGAARYAADSSTEILMAAVAVNDEEPKIWVHPSYRKIVPTHESSEVQTILEKYANQVETELYAHNAEFEHFITRFAAKNSCFPLQATTKKWRCTAAMARRAALPFRLGKLSEILKLDAVKDKEGARLIRKFSIPNNKGQRTLPDSDPADFCKFVEYCLQDVRTEQAVARKLSAFKLQGATLRTFLLDATINNRGIPVNVDALKKAQKIIDVYQTKYTNAYRSMTGLTPTQTVKSIKWFRDRGYPYKNLQAVNVDKALDRSKQENMKRGPWWGDNIETYHALEYKKMASYVAVTKVKKMLDCHVNGSVLGTLLYYGASTGRWSGKLIQPQNFKRPTIKDTDHAYKMICEGYTGQEIELLHGNPLEVISSCIRHFIQRPEGMIQDADYAAIEARIVCWLADQQDAIQRFVDKVDSYVDMATVIFGKPMAAIDSMQRWMGKQTVLGCGFQMGKNKFYEQCILNAEKFNMSIVVTKELAASSVQAFREKYNKVAELWWKTDKAARQAILNPGKRFNAGSKVWFKTVVTNGLRFLIMKLPSGRNIVYPDPRIERVIKTFEDENGVTQRKETDAITFLGQIPNKVTWGRVQTYGGKLVENMTQATAADIMAHGAALAEERGYRIMTLIHDEALCFDDGLPFEGYCKALSNLPSWAAGLPVEAEGTTIPYYKKI